VVKQVLIYWRDIPAQVIVQRGRVREKAQCSQRFHEAIDRAAMRAGKGSSDAYMSEWRRVTTTMESDAELRDIADQEISRFEAEFSDELLQQMIRNHGAMPDQT
jgi:hypothetical protein